MINKMVILHIASIQDDKCSGVSSIVPKHILYQQKYEQVALWNLFDYIPAEINTCYLFSMHTRLEILPPPFDKPDLVVFHEIYRAAFLRIYKDVLKYDIPYVIVPHGSLTKISQNKKIIKKKIANFLLFNSFIDNAKKINYLSIQEKQNSAFKKVDSFISTNGVEVNALTPEDFKKDGIVITYIGRIDILHKGLDIMVLATKSIESFLRDNSVQINIYGPGNINQINKLNNTIINNNLNDIIKLNDKVVGKRKEDILLNSTFYIQSSRSEGMPVGILEALSFGIPCIITEGTNLGDFVNNYDAGWVSKTNADALSEKIREAIENIDTFKQKSDNAKRLVKEKFDWEKITTNVLDEFSLIVKGE